MFSYRLSNLEDNATLTQECLMNNISPQNEIIVFDRYDMEYKFLV